MFVLIEEFSLSGIRHKPIQFSRKRSAMQNWLRTTDLEMYVYFYFLQLEKQKMFYKFVFLYDCNTPKHQFF